MCNDCPCSFCPNDACDWESLDNDPEYVKMKAALISHLKEYKIPTDRRIEMTRRFIESFIEELKLDTSYDEIKNVADTPVANGFILENMFAHCVIYSFGLDCSDSLISLAKDLMKNESLDFLDHPFFKIFCKYEVWRRACKKFYEFAKQHSDEKLSKLNDMLEIS